MPDNFITFQLPTHYLPKIALRLECLFLTINQACKENHPIIHHYALKNIIEIIELIEKPELKSRFLKEFIRIEHAVNKSQTSVSDKLYADLFLQVQYLNHCSGRFGESIHTDPFLQNIRVSKTVSHNDCEIQSPQLILWLEHNAEQRKKDLTLWAQHIQPLYNAVEVYLSLLRNAAKFSEIDLNRHFYQCALPSKTSCHLILLKMNKKAGLIPKMELGHHGLSIRVSETHPRAEIQQPTHLELAICQL